MAVLLKNGAVFLHIPKTGGNWITNVLQDLDLLNRRVAHKHADIDHYFSYASPRRFAKITHIRRKLSLRRAVYDLLTPPAPKPFMFCFVRNPLSWYESWFKYMTQRSRLWMNWGGEHDPFDWHPNKMLNGLGDPDFNQFICNVIHNRPGFVSEMYGWYTKPEMDFVGKQENLASDFVRVLQIMNVKFDEGYVRNYQRIGVSAEPEKRIVWNDSLRKEVALVEYACMTRDCMTRYAYPVSEIHTVPDASLDCATRPSISQRRLTPAAA